MKTFVLIIASILCLSLSAQDLEIKKLENTDLELLDFDTLTIAGKYKGKDVRLKNPFGSSDGKTYSVQSIMVDNELVASPFNQSELMISLTERDRKIGQDFNLIIIYLKGKKPEILNAEDLE